nr:piggyBac transposable element-derived protein 5-like [Vulpes vulpes]
MVARSLCRNAAGKNYIIFTGPSITSLTLFEELEKQEIYCCGLLSSRKSDCTGLPPSMLSNPATAPARGQHRIKMKGNMSLICWYNKGHFRFLTNAYSPVQQAPNPRPLLGWALTTLCLTGGRQLSGPAGCQLLLLVACPQERSHDDRIGRCPGLCMATESGVYSIT